tara:strand:+ start:2276 stop:3361 length:1086 start_codon:yes stop_codon:yes gene_type:complete
LNSISTSLLKLLLDDNKSWDQKEIDQLQYLSKKGPEFISIAYDNRVLLRALTKIIPLVETTLWPEKDDFLSFLREKQNSGWERIRKNIALAHSVQKAFEEAGVKSIAFKTMDNFPDMGRDIDLLIPDKEQFLLAKKIMLRDFGWDPAKKLSFCDSVVGKTFYTKEQSFDISVEIYPQHSQLGETYMSDSNVVNRRVKINIEGYDFFVPTIEDRILIMAIHRIYRHAVLRISDILNVSQLATSDTLDWDSVVKQSIESGAWAGLHLFLSTINNVYQQIVGEQLPIPFLKATNMFQNNSSIDMSLQDFPSKMPYIPTASVLMQKIGADFSNGRLMSGFTVSLMPILIGMTFITYTFFKKNFIW